MPAIWIILIVSWIVIINFPDIISYIIWGLLLFFWLNILFAKYLFNKASKSGESYVKFWNYKIFKD